MIKKGSWTRWRHGLVARTLLAVFLVVLVLAGVSSVIVSNNVKNRESQQAITALSELVETVSDTASIAAFTYDEQLAAEVVQGLMSNSDILRVTLRATEEILASAEREAPSASLNQADNTSQIVHTLTSPFQTLELIGEIVVDPDWDNINARISQTTLETLMIQIGQMALVVAIIAAIMLYLVVRPIKAISDRLHSLGAGSGNLLDIPRGHDTSEIGQLVGDINALTGRLVATLEQERDLQEKQIIARRKYENLFDHAASGIFVADSNGQLESFNRAFANLTWLPESTRKISRSLTEIRWRDPERLLSMLSNSLESQSTGDKYEDDFVLPGRHGSDRWVHIEVVALGDGNVQGTISDVTQRKQEEISAKHQAITDTLTGFSNRAGLQHRLHDLSSASLPFALIMVNLNGFKHINEALGFHIGDQLLLEVSTRLKIILSSDDHAARIDGDEFVLLLQGEQERSTLDLRMDELLQLLKNSYELKAVEKLDKPNSISISASIGIAFFPIDGSSLNDLLRSAELAFNSAEDRSESSYLYFDPAQQAAVEHRRRLEDDLRHALIANELELAFQPIIDITEGKMVGAEALMRWPHPEKGMIGPDIFIPLAEQIGLINRIGLFALEEACRHVADWRNKGMDIYVSVNVSAKQIPNGLTPMVVRQTLERYKLPPSAIVIEITESLLMANVTVAQTWIESIRALGIRIYLDDFGTGYSSLSYLKRFPMDTVKIDRAFIRDLYIDRSDRALIAAIITMANSLGLNVVAEGVEDEKQLTILREMGCRCVQGYYFSRPVHSTELAQSFLRINAELADDISVIG
ncbi:MAG: putative bifunctional diguanylate cyclase/phosphodiesterase [Gammaproteobacteria bacterium]